MNYIYCFQTNNVGKLNLEQIDNSKHYITTLQPSNLKQIKVYYSLKTKTINNY